MKLSEKIVALRKSGGMSQEALAEKLSVSRQAISRWEMGSAMPDASNILQLSRLFRVTADYLLNDEYESDDDLPQIRTVKTDGIRQCMILLVTLEVMTLILQLTTAFLLQSELLCILCLLPFAAAVGGFEYTYLKKADAADARAQQIRRHFYQISAWLGFYFPLRLLVLALMRFYPRPYLSLVPEGIAAALYLLAASLTTVLIGKRLRT